MAALSERAVSELQRALDELGVTVETRYTGFKRFDGDWDCFSWEVTLAFQGKTASFPFHTGLAWIKPGHPKIEKGKDGPLVYYRHRMVALDAYLSTQRDPLVHPTSADVVYSILIGPSAIEYDFPEWAEELGYSSDSIRARAKYDECQVEERKLRKLLGAQCEFLQEKEH